MDARATSSVVAVALLVGVAVLAATLVGTALFTMGSTSLADPPRVSLAATANASSDRIALRHTGGDSLRVSRLRVVVTLDGQPLVHQPPVPFFAAEGFRSGPTGPFNSASEDRWRAGETAAVRLASTNSPALEPGTQVEVTVYSGDYRVVRVTTRAG